MAFFVDHVNEVLLDGYNRILHNYAEVLNELDTRHSQLFLPYFDPKWSLGKKIVVIGRETKAWGTKDNIEDRTSEIAIQNNLTRYVNTYNRSKINGKKGFWHFMNSLSHCMSEDIIWLNLYALDYARSSRNYNTKNSPYFNQLRELSKELLIHQLTVIQPEVIVIACGVDATARKLRDEIFLNKSSVPYDAQNSNLWKFLASDFGDIPCYRIHHPASRKKKVLNESINVLKELLIKDINK